VYQWVVFILSSQTLHIGRPKLVAPPECFGFPTAIAALANHILQEVAASQPECHF
jgi:hypothetical protein